MFHCNGWTYPWAVTAVAGTHVCLRRVEPAQIFAAIERHGVTHMCGAPIVLNMLVHAPDAVKRRFDRTIEVATGGAAPPSTVIANMERMGFRVTHLYGLTESYGPATLCAWQEEWDALPLDGRAAKMARQGVAYPTLAGVRVADPATMADVPRRRRHDGRVDAALQHGDEGLSQEPEAATEAAFAGGWFHTGDLGVMHPGRLCRDQGPLQGHHHLRRREHLVARGRGGALPPSGGDGGGGGRAARRDMGREPLRLRHA